MSQNSKDRIWRIGWHDGDVDFVILQNLEQIGIIKEIDGSARPVEIEELSRPARRVNPDPIDQVILNGFQKGCVRDEAGWARHLIILSNRLRCARRRMGQLRLAKNGRNRNESRHELSEQVSNYLSSDIIRFIFLINFIYGAEDILWRNIHRLIHIILSSHNFNFILLAGNLKLLGWFSGRSDINVIGSSHFLLSISLTLKHILLLFNFV